MEELKLKVKIITFIQCSGLFICRFFFQLIMSRESLSTKQKFCFRKKIFWHEGTLWKQFHRDLSADSDAFSVIAQSHNADENVCMWIVSMLIFFLLKRVSYHKEVC